jgi:7-cyano-7-deazaguanine synthase in queuosine biosynthesis
MKKSEDQIPEPKSLCVDVVEKGDTSKIKGIRCEIGTNLMFNTDSMETYFFADWKPVLYDSLLVAAAVEFCDRTLHRPVQKWSRHFDLRIPVHEPERWNEKRVYGDLHELLGFLTGDTWNITFLSRKRKEERPRQINLKLGRDISAVMPFSNGLDSHAVAFLKENELRNKLVRVRLKNNECIGDSKQHGKYPFTSIPFKVKPREKNFYESSVRSRGFKFMLVSGIAAYLANANQVIVPESGQGIIGLVLVPVGQVYEDYRNHPLFTNRMENFISHLLGYNITYIFPQIWKTKGETLKEYIKLKGQNGPDEWITTISCWQPNWQISVDHKARQCGICAACMLRRLSVHAAGLIEPDSNYVWENLKATSFESGASAMFEKKRITNAMKDYAIAGTLHLAQIAELCDSFEYNQMPEIRAFQLSRVLKINPDDASKNLKRLLFQHKFEWENFLNYLGPNSFIVKWSRKVSNESA